MKAKIMLLNVECAARFCFQTILLEPKKILFKQNRRTLEVPAPFAFVWNEKMWAKHLEPKIKFRAIPAHSIECLVVLHMWYTFN